jgi:hypothetical protein
MFIIYLTFPVVAVLDPTLKQEYLSVEWGALEFARAMKKFGDIVSSR